VEALGTPIMPSFRQRHTLVILALRAWLHDFGQNARAAVFAPTLRAWLRRCCGRVLAVVLVLTLASSHIGVSSLALLISGESPSGTPATAIESKPPSGGGGGGEF
jgi:hypothetical protein